MRKKLTVLGSRFLGGQCEEITMMDLRHGPGDVIDQVQLGKTFVITRQGKPVAVLQALPGETLTVKIGPRGETSFAA